MITKEEKMVKVPENLLLKCYAELIKAKKVYGIEIDKELIEGVKKVFNE